MINGTLTSLRAYWKMRTTNSFGTIQTDHKIDARRQNLVLVDKREKCCQIIDMAIPEDSGLKEKEVPIVVGALGTVPLRLKLKGYRSRHINYPEDCIAGISEDTQKSIGNVKHRKEKHSGVPWQLVVSCYKNNSNNK